MENSIYKTILITMVIMMFLVLSSFTMKELFQNQQDKKVRNGFVVLELFTSQGCSSCPPADEVLAKYAMQNNSLIIPLAFHVDYWNYIGWKDPFSKAQFTERQRNYASQLKAQGNYTPQIVINGKHELVGSYKNEIQELVNKELAVPSQFNVRIKKATISNNELKVEYDADSNPNTVVNLAMVKKKEFTSIKRGENSGLKQTSYNIVFDFKTIKNYTEEDNTSSFQFSSDKIPSDYLVVAYLQNTSTGTIIGVTKSEIY